MKLRLPIVLAAAAFSCLAARAQSDESGAALARCAAIADPAARLQCYDQLSAGAKPSAPASGQQEQPAPFTSVGTSPSPAAPQPAAQQPSAPPSVAQQPPAVPPPAAGSTLPRDQTTPQQFGSEQLPAEPSTASEAAPRELDSIVARVVAVNYGAYGSFTVTLDNGQVWREMPGDSSRAYFSKDRRQPVKISRGLFGSYNLVIVGENALYKVERVK